MGTPDHGRRRWLAVAGIVAAALTATVLSSGVQVVDDTGSVTGPGGPITVERDDHRAWSVTRFQPGTTAQIRFDLAHRGPLPVRVTDLADSRSRDDVECGWRIDHSRVVDADGPPVADGTAVTDGVRLGAGDRLSVVVTGTFVGEPDCLHRAGARPTLLVDVEVVGTTRRQRIEPPQVLGWSTDPERTAARWATAPVAPRVGTAA